MKSKDITASEQYYVASQWQLMWRKFKKHKLATMGGTILVILYLGTLFCGFIAPYDIYERYRDYLYCPPRRIHFFEKEGFHFRPFVYGIEEKFHMESLTSTYTEDKTTRYPIFFFIRSHNYKFWNLFETDVHLFGTKGGKIFLFGTDKLGRDLFSRNLYAARISLSIGLVGVSLSFVLGCALGGISGYFGGAVDTIIQRIIEFLISIPTIPFWMALSAALPPYWSPIKIYLGITIILSLVGWCGLARVVRGKLLDLREEDFVMAAKIAGATDRRIIINHLLPSFFSYLIVSLTLSVPMMILGETALSFLGLGIRAPAVSWGTLLQASQNVQAVVIYPWFLIPGLFVIISALSFNFLGDGLRDAADPYK